MSAFAATSRIRAEPTAPLPNWWLPFLDSTSDAIRPFVASSGPTIAQPTSSVLTLSCQNQPGIVAAVTMHLFEAGWHIIDAQQHDDRQSGCFFMRLVLDAVRPTPHCVAERLKALSDHFGLTWTLRSRQAKRAQGGVRRSGASAHARSRRSGAR